MSDQDSATVEEAVQRLRAARSAYWEVLGEVVRHGENAVPHLVAALTDKRSMAAAEALGFLMGTENAPIAFPRLLDWLCAQTPMYPYALKALVQAGPRILPLWRERALEANATDDDEALRYLFDLACRFGDGGRHGEFGRDEIVEVLSAVFDKGSPHSVEAVLDVMEELSPDIVRTFADQVEQVRREGSMPYLTEAAAALLRRLEGR